MDQRPKSPSDGSFDVLDSTAGTSIDTRQITAVSSSTLLDTGPACIGHQSSVSRSEIISSTSGNSVHVYGGTPMFVNETSQNEHERNFEELKRENQRLKAMRNCYSCKVHDFTMVLVPCGHTACETCTKHDVCACKLNVEKRHICQLAPRNKNEIGQDWSR